MGAKNVLSISEGSARYKTEMTVVLKNINVSLCGGERLAVVGENACGKTTLFKAILNDPEIARSGVWDTPPRKDIGYLDQYYQNLDDNKTVLETIADLIPYKTYGEIRNFLNDFLFRKNEEVNKKNVLLSGGERARLSLAVIAAKTPKLLLLDEITNNVDLQTKNHITQALKEYPGAMLIISHERAFLQKINAVGFLELAK